MALLTLFLAALAVPVAAVICFSVVAILHRLGYRPPAERLTARDRRWLAGQRTDLQH